MNRKRFAPSLTILPPRIGRQSLIAFCLTLAMSTSGFAVAPPADPVRASATRPPLDLRDPARIEAGRKRFAKTCAGYCHGHEGVGGRAPDFKGRTDLGPQLTFDTISKGRTGADVMPPWGDAFSEEQIWELVAYLQYLGRQPIE
ncbi:c-type cytochrome [Denitromonas iodatirespirans]|uniref:Cytochrome c n=1 Tax=Denitromonas iodatirespirans TaxID=2795389 RepID=A0A944D8L2_DENI1|nr:cytochrome c [Denitromonas iodatirespirans]MBT0961964.1 cytochrome c [Denitromonas iodatirespirans]